MLTTDYCSEGELLGGVAAEKKRHDMGDIRAQWFGTIEGVATVACFGADVLVLASLT